MTSPEPTSRSVASRRWLLGGLVLGVILAGVLIWPQSKFPWRMVVRSEHEQPKPTPIEVSSSPQSPNPFVEPDFLDQPPLDLSASFEATAEPFLTAARQARPKIDALWKERSADVTWSTTLVPVPAKPKLQRDVNDDYYQFRLRELDAYRQWTLDCGAARVAGENFLNEYLRRACERDDARSAVDVVYFGSMAILLGSRDPLIRSYYAWERFQLDGDKLAAENVWRETLVELRASAYPLIVQTYVRTFLDRSEHQRPSDPPEDRFPALAVSLVRWLEEDSAHPEWRRSMHTRLERVWNTCDINQRTMLVAALMQSSRVDPYFVHLMAGILTLDRAWQVRGRSYADKVPASAWPEFARLVKQADEHLEYAWLLEPQEPLSSLAMISVAMAGHARNGRPYDWFLRTIETQFDNWLAYGYFREDLLPRWNGSIRHMVQFSQHCLDTDRFDTLVPYQALEMLEHLKVRELQAGQSLNDVPLVRNLLRDFVQRLSQFRERHPGEAVWGDSPHYRTKLGGFLDECDLPDEAAAIFAVDPTQLNFAWLEQHERFAKHLTWRAIAAVGDVRDRVLRFDEELRRPWSMDLTQEKVDELEQELRSLRGSPKHEAAHWYFDSAERTLSHLRAFATGEWAQLTFDPWLPGWEICADAWPWNAENPEEFIISQRHTTKKQFWARPIANFQPPLELEFSLETVEPAPYSRPYGLFYTTDLVWTEANDKTRIPLILVEPQTAAAIAEGRREERIGLLSGHGWRSRIAIERSSKPHHFQVRLWPDQAELRHGNRWIVNRIVNPPGENGFLCWTNLYPEFNAEFLNKHAGAIRLSKVRVRRNELPVPPADDGPIEQVEPYWRERLVRDPHDGVAYLRLAELLLEWDRPVEVISLLDLMRERSISLDRMEIVRGLALFQQCRYQDAIPVLIKAVEKTVDGPSYLALAQLFALGPERSRNLGIAQSAADSAEQALPEDDPWRHATVAVAAAARGDFETARSRNQTALVTAVGRLKQQLINRQAEYEAGRIEALPTGDVNQR